MHHFPTSPTHYGEEIYRLCAVIHLTIANWVYLLDISGNTCVASPMYYLQMIL